MPATKVHLGFCHIPKKVYQTTIPSHSKKVNGLNSKSTLLPNHYQFFESLNECTEPACGALTQILQFVCQIATHIKKSKTLAYLENGTRNQINE